MFGFQYTLGLVLIVTLAFSSLSAIRAKTFEPIDAFIHQDDAQLRSLQVSDLSYDLKLDIADLFELIRKDQRRVRS